MPAQGSMHSAQRVHRGSRAAVGACGQAGPQPSRRAAKAGGASRAAQLPNSEAGQVAKVGRPKRVFSGCSGGCRGMGGGDGGMSAGRGKGAGEGRHARRDACIGGGGAARAGGRCALAGAAHRGLVRGIAADPDVLAGKVLQSPGMPHAVGQRGVAPIDAVEGRQAPVRAAVAGCAALAGHAHRRGVHNGVANFEVAGLAAHAAGRHGGGRGCGAGCGVTASCPAARHAHGLRVHASTPLQPC